MFLRDNYRVPSLYREDPEHPGKFILEEPLSRFPVLPPAASARNYTEQTQLQAYLPDDDVKADDLITEDSTRGNLDSWDAFLAAGAWYTYAQDPMPPPAALPGEMEPARGRQRINHHMQTVIFRHYPARAQSYVAERLEEEGWFGNGGWVLDWFANGPQLRVTIGDHHDWAVNAWSEAAKMWEAHGLRNHLLLDADPVKHAEKERALRDLAARYRVDKKMAPTDGLPAVEDDPKLREEWEASRFLIDYDGSRNVTSFERNSNRAEVEKLPKTVRVRELFYDAAALAMAGSTLRALNKYQNPDPVQHPDPVLGTVTALDAWGQLLTDHDDFRHDDLTAEESYEVEMDYLDILNRALPANELKAQLGAAALAGGPNVIGQLEALRPTLLPPLQLTQGPFDRTEDTLGVLDSKPKTAGLLLLQSTPLTAAAGCCYLSAAERPWIPDTAKRGVMERRRTYQPRKKDTLESGPAQPKPEAPGVPPMPQGPPAPGKS